MNADYIRRQHDRFKRQRRGGTASVIMRYGDQVGSRNKNATLNERKVAQILKAKARGATNAALSEQYGVAPRTISRIWSGEFWPHVPGPRRTRA